MVSGTLYGLVVIGLGLLSVAISGFLARRMAILRSWFSAKVDLAWWTQREKPKFQFFGWCLVVVGIGIALYGAFNGT